MKSKSITRQKIGGQSRFQIPCCLFKFYTLKLSQNAAAIAELVERQVSDRKVADPWFDSRTGNACCVLGKDTLPIFPKQSTRSGGPAQRKTCKQNSKHGGLRWCD